MELRRRRRESIAVAVRTGRRCRGDLVRITVVGKMARAETVVVWAWDGEGRRHGGRRRTTESRIVWRRGLMGLLAKVGWLGRVGLAWDGEESVGRWLTLDFGVVGRRLSIWVRRNVVLAVLVRDIGTWLWAIRREVDR